MVPVIHVEVELHGANQKPQHLQYFLPKFCLSNIIGLRDALRRSRLGHFFGNQRLKVVLTVLQLLYFFIYAAYFSLACTPVVASLLLYQQLKFILTPTQMSSTRRGL